MLFFHFTDKLLGTFFLIFEIVPDNRMPIKRIFTPFITIVYVRITKMRFQIILPTKRSLTQKRFSARISDANEIAETRDN